MLHLVLMLERDGKGFRALPLADGEHFMKLVGEEERRLRPPPVSVSLMQEQALMAAKDEGLRAPERRNPPEFDLSPPPGRGARRAPGGRGARTTARPRTSPWEAGGPAAPVNSRR